MTKYLGSEVQANELFGVVLSTSIIPDNLPSATTLQSTTILENVNVSSSSVTHSTVLSTTSLVELVTITGVENINVAHYLQSPNVTQLHLIGPADIESLSTLQSTSFTQLSLIAAANLLLLSTLQDSRVDVWYRPTPRRAIVQQRGNRMGAIAPSVRGPKTITIQPTKGSAPARYSPVKVSVTSRPQI